jgi:hypothetical protein
MVSFMGWDYIAGPPRVRQTGTSGLERLLETLRRALEKSEGHGSMNPTVKNLWQLFVSTARSIGQP